MLFIDQMILENGWDTIMFDSLFVSLVYPLQIKW